MKYLRKLLINLCIIGGLSAQSPHNSGLYGLFIDHTEAAGFALGSVGILPSHNAHFSIGNPATWPELKFAFLSGQYSTGEIRQKEKGYLAGFGFLSNANFIVPIKNKYAFGLGIKPITRKVFHLEDKEFRTVVFDEDTLFQSKNIEGMGGLSSFYTAFSWQLNSENTLAIQLDFQFGTFNEFTSSRLFENNPQSEPPVVYQRHFQFNMKFLTLYYFSKSLLDKYNLMSYSSLQVPMGPKFLRETDSPPFVDMNLDNIHSSNELPYLENAESKIITHNDFPVPVTITSGILYKIIGRTYIGGEVLGRIIPQKSGQFLNSVSTNQNSGYRLNLSLLREAKQGARQLTARLHYRIGIFHHQHYISSRRKPLIQNGIGFGIGIPFGLIQNQIDIGFRFSRKDGFLTETPEYIREVSVGLSLGDVWLIKGKRR